MTVENLKRVMNRLRSWYPDKVKLTRMQLKKAIMVECGTSYQTYVSNRRALIDLGWIKTNRQKYYITGLDLTEDFDYAGEYTAKPLRRL